MFNLLQAKARWFGKIYLSMGYAAGKDCTEFVINIKVCDNNHMYQGRGYTVSEAEHIAYKKLDKGEI